MGAACGNFDAGRENRVMYVSPSIKGFYARVSHGEQDSLDAALFYEGNPVGLTDFDVVAALGYRYNGGPGAAVPGRGLGKTNVYSGSIGVLHKPTGLNVNFAAGTRIFQGDPAGNPKNPNFWYVEGGWTGNIRSMGETSIAGNFGAYNHITQDAHAWVAGIAFAQKVEAAATDLYAGYRYADAKLNGTRLEAVNILIVGARIKF
jgi:hypothetical protein